MKYEAVGLCGTVFILIAFMFNDEKRIRIFDLIGAVLFVAYGFLIGAYSNVVLNGILIVIQFVKLRRIHLNAK